MTKKELGLLYPIIIVEYDSGWSQLYEKEKSRLLEILGPNIALRIEHIGSTAVNNLKAKPTIDVLVEIPSQNDIKEVIKNMMVQNGYIYMKEQVNHLMLVKGYSSKGLENESYHIHMGPKNQDFLWDRLYFRDYLRKFPSIAKEYEKLKIELSIKYKHDREAYTEKKAEFIKKITELGKKFFL